MPDDSDRMTRADHIAWSKARALEYVEAGDLSAAVASMISDMGKLPSTSRFALNVRAREGILTPLIGAEAVREWIDGFY